MIGKRARPLALIVLLGLAVAACVRVLDDTPQPQVRPLILPTLAISDVTVVTMREDRAVPHQTILLRGDRILAIGPQATTSVPMDVPVIDGRGLTALPGLWDMHVHVLWTDAEQAVTYSLPFMLRHGIVGVRDMGASAQTLRRARDLYASTRQSLPDLIAAGPLIDGPRSRWSLPVAAPVAMSGEVGAAVEAAKAAGADFIKPYAGLTPALYADLALAARQAGLQLAGHVPNAMSVDAVLAAGQRSIEHLELNLSRSCGKDEPATLSGRWLAAWAGQGFAGRYRVEVDGYRQRNVARCARLMARIAAAPVWWTPTLAVELRDAKGLDRGFVAMATERQQASCRQSSAAIARVPEALRHEVTSMIRADVRALHKAGVKLLAGSDFSNDCIVPVDGLWRELDQFVAAGLTPYEALRTATVEPAAYLDRGGDAGTLEPGKIADILLVRGDPLDSLAALRAVDTVIRKGEVVNRMAVVQ